MKKRRYLLTSLLALTCTCMVASTLTSCNNATAEKGEKGDKGDAGSNGANGKDGVDGKDGKDGEDLTKKDSVTSTNKDIKSSKFYVDSESMDDSLAKLKKTNQQIAEEGYVLLKNDHNYLPIKEGSKISVFGKTSGDFANALENSGFEVNQTLKDFYADKTKSGDGPQTKTNGSFWPTGETPQASYTAEVKESYDNYHDVAVVVFSREGGEGSDLPRCSFAETKGQTTASSSYPTREQIESGTWTPVGGQGRESNPFQHYLELDDNERALLKALENDSRFQDVVVILASNNSMETDFLDDNKTYGKIRAGIWAETSGASNIGAIGSILKGEVSPSGRTPDIIERDFTKDPTWQNYANNFVGNENGFDSAMGDEYTTEEGLLYKDSWDQAYYGLEYQEGIYNGYKYYETRGLTDGETWYENNVQYPFGYGLSYTTFNWNVVSTNIADRQHLSKNDEIQVDVKVTNTGDIAGKDVVELYYNAPYTSGGIEKSHVKLGDFAKTGLLLPGQSETVTLTLTAKDMASYDCYDVNKNGFKGYELEKGTYNLYVSKNSHSWAERSTQTISYVVDDTIKYETDEVSGTKVENQFDYMSEEMKGNTLSRTDWNGTFPSRPLWYDVENDNTIDPLWSAEYRATHNGTDYQTSDKSVTPSYLKKENARLVKSTEWLNNFDLPLANKDTTKKTSNFELDTSYDEDNKLYGGGKAPWYSSTSQSFRDESEAYSSTNKAPIQLKDLMNTSIDDKKWDEFVSQFTEKQAIEQIITPFNFVANEALGMPVGAHADGNTGLRKVFDLIAYLQDGDRIQSDKVSNDLNPTALGATWNKELSYQYGERNGDLALWTHISGWYGPSCNLHRSHFSGRNSQYFSEDGVLSGKMISGVTKGANDKGLVTFVKHFALNDQETHRDITGISTWTDEQTLRENYLKPYELVVKEGETTGMMASFNRIGYEWTGASYKLLTSIARDEWNFKGIYITDAAGTDQAGNYMSADMMLRAGLDMSLDGVAGGYDASTDTGTPKALTGLTHTDTSNTSTHKQAIFNATKRIAYVISRSNAMMNGESLDAFGYDSSAKELQTRFGAIQNEADITVLNVQHSQNVTLDVSDSDLDGVRYVQYSGDLLGLKLNEYTGNLTGTIRSDVKAGKYLICIGAIREDISSDQNWTAPDVNYFYINVAE